MKTFITPINTAVFLALLFHISGAIGILCTPYKDWFIQNTPLNLWLMTALLFWLQPQKNLSFFLFFAACFLVGMTTEMIGVNTGKLFGNYAYGNLMGPKLNGVPYLIGINWFVVVFCSGVIIEKYNNLIQAKLVASGIRVRPALQTITFVFDGALLATLFDFAIEPVAMKINFWQWQNNNVPTYNFACWFVISAVLLLLFRQLKFNKRNHFAVHLFIIQYLFFTALQTYL